MFALAALGLATTRAAEIYINEIMADNATNAPLANYAMVTTIQRISNMSSDDGLYVESLMAAVAQTSPEVVARIGSFLNRKGQGPQK